MDGSIYDFGDYREFLKGWIRSRPSAGHGERSRIAIALRCHVAYISLVLKGSADLSFEQAQDLADYVGLDEERTDYLLLLVGKARAGTPRLREGYARKLESMLASRRVLKNRFKSGTELSTTAQATYFSAWYYSAIHILIMMMPGFDRPETIEEYLRLPKKLVQRVIHFLENEGLISRNDTGYIKGPLNIHLGTDSGMLSKHHTNWRIAAIQSFEYERPHDLHYSSAVAINRKDAEKIRKLFIDSIERARAVITESKSENALYSLSIDLFEVGK
jgi:uncharacterized protein (TIGR02147 family)